MTEDLDVIVESTRIIFTNTDTGSHSFTKIFTSAPFITATAYDANGNQITSVLKNDLEKHGWTIDYYLDA